MELQVDRTDFCGPQISLGKQGPEISLGKQEPQISLGKQGPEISLGKQGPEISLGKQGSWCPVYMQLDLCGDREVRGS